MKIYDIDALLRDRKQDDLYDFFNVTMRYDNTIPYRSYIVSLENEMRMDLVCKGVYNSLDEIDALMSINDIDNPLNIMMNDQILYPPLQAIQELRVNVAKENEVRNKLLNANKSTRKDDSRQKYVEDNYTLPPTVQREPTQQVRIENNELVIG
jgi:hypothetical protein